MAKGSHCFIQSVVFSCILPFFISVRGRDRPKNAAQIRQVCLPKTGVYSMLIGWGFGWPKGFLSSWRVLDDRIVAPMFGCVNIPSSHAYPLLFFKYESPPHNPRRLRSSGPRGQE